MTVRVLVCNRICLYAEGMRRLLEEDEAIRVVGLACHDRDFEDLEALAPELVITDAACFPRVAGRAGGILLIWDGRNPLPPFGDLKAMVDHGLMGILEAGTDPLLLRKAVAKVRAGELWVDHRVIHRSLCAVTARPSVHLSPREAEILRYICAGHSNKEIAERLCISEQTVKTHCNHLFKKFGVASRLQLALRVQGGGEEAPD